MAAAPDGSILRSNAYSQFFSFFGLRENPFAVSPDPRYLFMTRPIQEAWGALEYGIQSREGIIVLIGEAGTGKTTVINRLLDMLRERRMPTAYIFNSHLEAKHLFDFMMADFGIQPDPRWQGNALLGLSQWLRARSREGQIPVLIVDEAQGLPIHVLEEIRLLVNLETPNEKLLQIVLAGQPELDEKLRRPELRQLKQRIAFRCRTGALTIQDAQEYIQVRLNVAGASGKTIFSPDAVNAVHGYSRGIPRVMNLLCEHALINAYAGNLHVVPARVVEEIAREFQFDRDVHAPTITSGATPITARIYEPLIGTDVALPRGRMTAYAAAQSMSGAPEIAATHAWAAPSVAKPTVAEGDPIPLAVACGKGAIDSPGPRKISDAAMHPPIVRGQIERIATKPAAENFYPSRNMGRILAAMQRWLAPPSIPWSKIDLKTRDFRNGVQRLLQRALDERIRNRIVVAAKSRVALGTQRLSAMTARGVRSLGIWWREAVRFWQKQQETLRQRLRHPRGHERLSVAQVLTVRANILWSRLAEVLHLARIRQKSLQTVQPVVRPVVRHKYLRSANAPLRRWLREPFRLSRQPHPGPRAEPPRDRIGSAL